MLTISKYLEYWGWSFAKEFSQNAPFIGIRILNGAFGAKLSVSNAIDNNTYIVYFWALMDGKGGNKTKMDPLTNRNIHKLFSL